MKPIYQKFKHIPGLQNGDCWRACLASILECSINTFPHMELNEEWSQYYLKIYAVLEQLGYYLDPYTVQATNIEDLDGKDTDGYIVAIGKSPRSTKNKRINHSVVWKNGIVHDPHPDNTGILDIITFEVLVKIK